MRQKKSLNLIFLLCLSLSAGFLQAAQLPDFTAIVEESSTAVVNISTTQKTEASRFGIPRGAIPGIPEGTPFEDFFRRFFDENRSPNQEAHSLGSGFIISDDGYILTNNHVVQNADEVIVRLSDRRELEARVIGSDPRSDVALLKVEAEHLPVVKIGDSRELKVGEWVLAIGSPFDFDHSVTAGIVSALGRSLPNENYVPFIQTDVAINPGNSGGPLFNLKGEVVGINAQIYSRTGGFMGLSFTIPIVLAMDVVDQLKNAGHVTRGWLGVLIQDVTRELAESFNMEKPVGALVSQVLPDSPAMAAGLEVGDVIVKFNGMPISTSSSLPPMVGVTPVDKKVSVEVVRQGEVITLWVSIGVLPSDGDVLASTELGSSDKNTDPRLKIAVQALDGEKGTESSTEKKGVLVVLVEPGPAQEAGIHEGDIVLMLNNQNVNNVVEFSELSKSLPVGKLVPVLIRRQSGPLFLVIKIPED